MRKAEAVLTLLFCFLMLACAGKPDVNRPANANASAAANNNSNSAQSNAEELGLLVNIPYELEDVAWKQDEASKKLTAVLLLKPQDAAAFVAEAERVTAPSAANVSSETWFPAELVAQSGLSGEDNLKGTAYAPTTFLQPPYTSGRVTRIENTDYFILELEVK